MAREAEAGLEPGDLTRISVVKTETELYPRDAETAGSPPHHAVCGDGSYGDPWYRRRHRSDPGKTLDALLVLAREARYVRRVDARRTAFAAASVAVAAVLTLIGTFKDGDEELWTWLVVAAVFLVGAGIVFWGIVPRMARLGRGALVLAVVGAVLLVVFWTGLPPIFAGAAALLALRAREQGTHAGMATAALVVAALTVAAATVAAIIG